MFNIKINRNGYGSNFNNIYVNDGYKYLKKEAINSYAKSKLYDELKFYDYVKINNINIKIPDIIEYSLDYYVMNYIKSTFSDDTYNYDFKKMIPIIINELKKLYKYNKIVDREYYNKIILEETIAKIKNRFEDISTIIYDDIKIKKINNLELLSFNEILIIINDKINCYLNSIKSDNNPKIEIIHGDPQLNNIIINNDDIYFIDPKGRFGSSELFGIKEYDIAKLYVSQSGYLIFDDMNQFQINDESIFIDFISIPDFDLHSPDEFDTYLIKLFFITIWLSNAHVFKENISKVKYSHYIALYFATHLINDI